MALNHETGYNRLQYYQRDIFRVLDGCSELERLVSLPVHQVTPTGILVKRFCFLFPVHLSPL